MKKKYSSLLLVVLLISVPVFAVFNGENLGHTLKILRRELQEEHQKMAKTQDRLSSNYAEQHQKMVDIMKQCNELSLMLYSQKQNFTFDLCYALEKVTQEYNDFNKDKMPYDRIVSNLNIEIDRYARLIETLRRLPPERNTVKEVPDSLAYHNDSLDMHLLLSGTHLDLEVEAALADTTTIPFVLDENSEIDRDSCIYYASELLKMYAETKAIIVADSVHYRETHIRLKESYDYARKYYKVLQNRIFIEGQTPWLTILSNPKYYWQEVSRLVSVLPSKTSSTTSSMASSSCRVA